MTSKTKPTPQKEQAPEEEESAPLTDRPLLDLSDAAINELIHMAKTRGHVTHDQIIALSKEVNSEQVEDILAKFSENGVNVVEAEELPPGRARLATRPSLTGSSPTMKAIGTVAVAALTANVTAMPPLVVITATCRRTSSAASTGSRSN